MILLAFLAFAIAPSLACRSSGPIERLMVASGRPQVESLKTEVINVASEEEVPTTCQSIGDFPQKNAYATGGILETGSGDNVNHVPIICGGDNGDLDNRDDYSDKCYVLQKANNQYQWTLMEPRMKAKRQAASSIVYGNNIWITGGKDGPNRLKSTEIVTMTDSNTFEVNRGPDLPIPSRYHCMVKLNSTTAMLIGGSDQTGSYLNK